MWGGSYWDGTKVRMREGEAPGSREKWEDKKTEIEGGS